MNILFVVPYVPNLVRTRPYNLIRYLAARGNRVTLLTVWSSEQERADLEHLQSICDDVQAVYLPSWRSLLQSAAAVPGRAPLQSVYSWTPQLVRHLVSHSPNGRSANGHSANGRLPYDVIHVEHLRGSRFGLYLKQHTGLPVVWDSVDCISHLFNQAAAGSKNLLGRLRSRFELKRTERYEGWLLDKFDHVLVTSAVDRQALLALAPPGTTPAPVSVAPNGVDVDYFAPDTAVVRDPASLVISGKMSYHANVSMVMNLMHNIMPLVWQRRADVKVWIVGKDPTREIQALAAHENVTVTGTVPDLRPYLRQATTAVTPLTYGAGIQNKVLEAMACATPVITTPQATAAIDVMPGRDLLVAADAESYAHAILHLLDHPQQQQQIGQAARAYVERHHHWNNVAAQVENIYRNSLVNLDRQTTIHH